MKNTSVSCGSNSRGLFIWSPQGRRKRQGSRKILDETMVKICPNSIKTIYPQKNLNKPQIKKHEESYIEI